MTHLELLIAAAAAVGAGAINALAGGGTLISFPVLVALGVPPVAANITNAVALCPGYFGAMNINIRSGRAFEESDRGQSVAVLSDKAAKLLWPS